MKRIIALSAVVAFVLVAVSSYAEEAKKDRNLITIVQSTLKPGPGKEKNKLRDPFAKVTTSDKACCASKAKAVQQPVVK